MRSDQLALLTSTSAPEVHPDGTWAVVATSRPDFDADGYVGQLWRVPLDGSGATRLTRGQADSDPRFSPDGRIIGFLRSGANDKTQLHLIPAGGGEALCVTNAKLGVSEFCFSPDSQRVVYTATVAEDGRYGTTEGVGAGQEDPRHITWLGLRLNGAGYLRDKPAQLFVIDLPDLAAEPPVKPTGRAAKALQDGAKPEDRLYPPTTQLTQGGSISGPVFAADGASVFAIRAALTEPETLASEFVRIPLDGAEPTLVLEPGAVVIEAYAIAVSAAGDVAFTGGELGESGMEFVGENEGVFRVEGGSAIRITDPDQTMGSQPRFAEDGALWVAEALRGRSRLHRLAAGADQVVLDDDRVIHAVATVPGDPDAALIAYTSPTSAGDLALMRAGQVTPLTDFSAALRAQTVVRAPRELIATSPDGYPVHGWTLLPDGDGPHPVLLNIHGGPHSQYVGSYFDEFQVYAQAGYAVVACNPRGSSGYGADHAKAIQGEFGVKDAADVLAFLDHAVATVPSLDGARVGVMGGSYGGYLTAWLIGIDHRWAGAIVERAFLDPAGFVGSSDIGWFFPHQFNGAPGAQWDAQSPMLKINDVTTPTLVLHSEQDLRCPLSEALRYYTNLKLAGADTELLVFPGETHELSRSGTPWHRRQRFEAILTWWAKHLPTAGGRDQA